MKFPLPHLSAALLLGVATLAPAASAANADRPLEFNRDVRPILIDNCISCHGPDSASREADLRLDRRDDAVDMAAIVPGDPDSSEMIRRILSEDESEVMPPAETKKHLTEEQKQTLVRWIEQGAEYQPHWSLIAPTRPAQPTSEQHAEWVLNPIDAFVLAKLEAAGLEPAPEADRRTLARRVALDLTGLPPTPEQVEEFLTDESSDAYEKYVDRLLASPKWGEHRGRYWLDAARYGDTHGIHIDNYREMWSYRDWVIKAFNKNMPFDQFTIENLAGDLLPKPTLNQQIASGFNRCNITTSEGGAIDEEYAVLYTRDRTDTTAQVWLGLTAGCAVCHDHKFDPLSQREFYAMSAFFNNTTQRPMDGNVKDTPPIVAVPLEEDTPRWEALDSEIPAAEQAVAAHREQARPAFDAWLAKSQRQDVDAWIPTSGLHLLAPLNNGGDEVSYAVDGQETKVARNATVEWREGKTGAKAAYLNQGAALEVAEAGDFEADHAFSYAAWVKLPGNDSSGSIMARMDDGNGYRGWDMWIEGRRVGTHIISRWPENAIKVVTSEPLPADEWVHVAVSYDGTRKAGGVKVFVNGQAKPVSVMADSLTESTRTTVPLKVGQRQLGSPLSGISIEDVRIYDRQLSDSEANSLGNAALFAAVVSAPVDERKPADVDALYGWWFANVDDQGKELVARCDALARERSDIRARGTIAHIMQEQEKPANAFILNRGEYDQRLDEVAPATPEFLPPYPAELPKNRLGFAEWLLLPEQPLTTRVTVNRFWQEIFGQGLVRTAGDFGVSGELPSHPELLDWLAVEFRESDWDVKRFFKLLVTSAAYRQSALTTPEKLESDPDNRLLSRGPRFRMDAEMIRDYALAASGLLSPKIGGPSVKPYQPGGVWEAVAMLESNTRNYQADAGEALYRRSMYTFWKRSAPPASLEIFNAPNREHCTVVRERTNTPLQALVTLNDPQYIEAARQLAQRTLQEASPSFPQRLSFVAERLLAREFTPEEASVIERSLAELSEFYAAHGDETDELLAVGETKVDPAAPRTELAAWTMVVNQLMNLDETLNK